MKVLGRIYLWAVYLFLYLPIAVVILFSFNNARYSTHWAGFTVRWYKVLAGNSQLIEAAVNSLTVGTLGATLATILGTMTAICLSRKRFFGQKFLHGGIYLLTVSPEIVMGIAMLIFFIALRVELGFATLLISHITLCLPFVVVTVLARLSSFDEHLVEAARDLGASERQALRHVVLPLILPAVAAGWLLSFTLSMDDVLISFFVAGPDYEVLPLRVYSMVRLGVKPDINALSAILFGVTIVVVLLVQTLIKVRKK